ncbi:MAG: hypothetical protein FJY55_04260 [Betaproteobacteria bacterium]|nr:hypothetical protein [Betaproteobacteria bacterium]
MAEYVTETARVPVPAGKGRDWTRLGALQPALMEAIEAQSHQVALAHSVDELTLEAMRIRVARHHHCER